MGFVDIGNGDQTHFEALLALFQLARDGFFFALAERQVGTGTQHFQIAGDNAEIEVFGIAQVFCFVLAVQCLAALVAVPVFQAKQRLYDAGGVAGGVVIKGVNAVHIQLFLAVAAVQFGLRQQTGAGLFQYLLVGHVLVFYRCPLWIILLRQFIGALERYNFSMGGCSHQCCQSRQKCQAKGA